MIRALIALSVAILISGCYYSSEKALHADMKPWPVTAFYGSGTSAFKSGDTYIVLTASGNTLKAERFPNSTSTYTVSLSSIVQPRGESFYIGVHKASKGYQYYPFRYFNDGFALISPPSVTEAETASELISQIKADKDIKSSVSSYKTVPSDEVPALQIALQTRLERNKEKLKQESANKSKQQEIANKSKQQESANKSKQNEIANKSKQNEQKQKALASALSKYDIGDGVYVEGWFDDELAVIQRIDYDTGKIKVRRTGDGTSIWVDHSKLISREAAQARDIGRAAGAIALFYCALGGEGC